MIRSDHGHAFFPDLVRTMGAHGFREVADAAKAIPDADLVLKRQTWNTNRAIVVVSLPEVPADFASYIRRLRKPVAFRCGFFPIFWGIGIQIVTVAPGLAQSDIDPSQHVALVDNQWAIVQSLFLVDPAAQTYQTARTWGQLVTGTYQDAIAGVLARHYSCYSMEPTPR